MRLLVLLLLPLMTYSMDKAYEQAIKDAQKQISHAYSDMYFSIALYNKIEYSKVVEKLMSAECKEKEHAQLLTADFYNTLYLEKIMLIYGSAQAYHMRAKERYEKDKQFNFFILCEASAIESVALELRERIRKKANR